MDLEPIKFQKKYRISSTKREGWDYSQNASYFVTICTKYKEPWFGEIKNGFMCLSAMGQISANCWKQVPNHFSYVKLGEWVVMPDHMHGIIEINKPLQTDNRVQCAGRVETYNYTSLQRPCANEDPGYKYSKIAPKKGSLGSIIRSYKKAVTIQSRKINPDFSWQPRFHGRIIRSQKEYNAFSDYVRLNPKNWKDGDV